MKIRLRTLSLLLLTAGMVCAPALADTAPGGENTAAADPAQVTVGPANSGTRILVNDKDHTVRILVDGKEILTIDADGLHVQGNVNYTGVINDEMATTKPATSEELEKP